MYQNPFKILFELYFRKVFVIFITHCLGIYQLITIYIIIFLWFDISWYCNPCQMIFINFRRTLNLPAVRCATQAVRAAAAAAATLASWTPSRPRDPPRCGLVLWKRTGLAHFTQGMENYELPEIFTFTILKSPLTILYFSQQQDFKK